MAYLKQFCVYLKVEKDLSDLSIESYERDLNNFIDYIGNRDLATISTTDIRSYIAHLSDLGRKRSTINRNLCALKSFYAYLKDIEKVINQVPTDSIKLSKREKSLPKALSTTDVNKLIETTMRQSIKNRLIIELLYGSGGRVSEIVSLRIEDIDFDNHYIRIVGKGNKERHTPIHNGCIELINQYMNKYNITKGYLFPKENDSSQHMTREGAYRTVKRVAKASGVDPATVSPHVFRHSFATHMLDNGCDMAIVQEYLGHEDISTTKIYAKVSMNNKAVNYQKFHPLAQ